MKKCIVASRLGTDYLPWHWSVMSCLGWSSFSRWIKNEAIKPETKSRVDWKTWWDHWPEHLQEETALYIPLLWQRVFLPLLYIFPACPSACTLLLVLTSLRPEDGGHLNCITSIHGLCPQLTREKQCGLFLFFTAFVILTPLSQFYRNCEMSHNDVIVLRMLQG